jgi:hypothetical protein
MGHVHLTMAKEEKQVPLDIVESYLDQEPWMSPWINTWVLYKSSLHAFEWDIDTMNRFCAMEIGVKA